jgi:hypothetical protein
MVAHYLTVIIWSDLHINPSTNVICHPDEVFR